jgi:hypothetical protein
MPIHVSIVEDDPHVRKMLADWIGRASRLAGPLQLMSSTSITGLYSAETAALINPSAKTITVPKSTNLRFYRLASSTPYRLGRPTVSGNNVVLNYQ